MRCSCHCEVPGAHLEMRGSTKLMFILERDRDRQTETDRQTGRQTDRRERETDRDTETETERGG